MAEARLALAVAAALSAAAAVAADTSDLVSQTAFRVCADPANLPFSNDRGEGFENAVAEVMAEALGRPVAYTFYPMATGFVRRTLFEGRCDVIIGYAQGDELVLNTNHYYTSAYALVVPADGPLAGVETLGDPLLKGRRIGVPAGTPAADHMARNGHAARARPYKLMVDTRVESPAADMIADLLAGEIDAAVMWGPIAGWRAKQAPVPLKVTPLLREEGPPRLFYRITMGVRQGEETWKRQLNALIRRNQDRIDAILTDFGVPLVDEFGRAP